MKPIRRIKVIPTAVSLVNLLCGFASITYSLKAAELGVGTAEGGYALYLSAMCVCFAMVADLLDGRIARMTGGESQFGAEMDSLSDVVSFGVAPALMVKTMIDQTSFPHRSGWVLAAAYTAFAAMRLARYNAEKDVQPGERFSGLPSPAAAGAIASLVLLYVECTQLELRTEAPSWLPRALVAGLPVYMLILGILMVTRIRYSHLGRKVLSGRKPFMYLVILALLSVLAALRLELTLSAGFTIYVVMGPAMELGRFLVRRPVAATRATPAPAPTEHAARQ